ncbi:MAG: glycolate oxidase subunit GlcE [Gammaproteobacteria bacterium]
MNDQSKPLAEAVQEAFQNKTPLKLVGGDSKAFLPNPCDAAPLSLAEHRGVVSYEPTELVITARSGTSLTELRETLADKGQHLPFEPPGFAPSATLGGTLACGLSGPARPYAGAARDMVLGTRIINGKGESLKFGGEVMKNVAGYDLSRLMVGAFGTLGLITEASLKVLPVPPATKTLSFSMDQAEAIRRCNEWAGQPYPITATAWNANQLYVRLSGAAQAVESAHKSLGGELEADNGLWNELAEHKHPFFRPLSEDESLWRLSVPQTAAVIDNLQETLVEWGGGQRWIISTEGDDLLRDIATKLGGHATRFRSAGEPRAGVFQAPKPGLMAVHTRVKQAMDPAGILNPCVLYPEF